MWRRRPSDRVQRVVQEINYTKCNRGCAKYIQKAKEENLKFKKALWRENDKEIRTEMDN